MGIREDCSCERRGLISNFFSLFFRQYILNEAQVKVSIKFRRTNRVSLVEPGSRPRKQTRCLISKVQRLRCQHGRYLMQGDEL